MKLIKEALADLTKSVEKNDKVIFFLAFEAEIRNQIIAQYAIEQHWALSHWTHMGFVQNMQAVETGDGKAPTFVPIPSAEVYNLGDAIKQVLPKMKENKEIFVFEVMDYKNITPDVVQILADNKDEICKAQGVLVFSFNIDTDTINEPEVILEHQEIKDILLNNSASYIYLPRPNLEERKEAIIKLLEFHADILGSETVKNADGTETQINFNHPIDDNNFMKDLASVTNGLTHTQIGVALAYSIVANRGVVDKKFVERATEDLLAVQNGIDNIPKGHFTQRITELQADRPDNYISESTLNGYGFRLLLEYLRARNAVMNFITGRPNGYSPLLEDIFRLMQKAPEQYKYGLVKYNAITEEVENIFYHERQSRSEEEEKQFEELNKLIAENKGKVTPKQILQWYHRTRDDDFWLYMQGFSAKDKYEQAAISHCAELDQLSYKNLIITHEDTPAVDNLLTSGFCVFYI